MSSLPTNLWMLCPDCGREICEIVSIFLSFNSTPMVKLRCKCTPYQVTNITLKDYIKSLNNAPFNNIHCISHPQIQECTDFCVECKHWLCSQCVKTHERGHIKYHSDSTISGYCLLHNSKLKFHCEICDIDLCELCDHNKEHQLVNLKELYEETYKSIGFKNNEDIVSFYSQKEEDIKKYKDEKIGYLDQTIHMIEKVKGDIEKEYQNLVEKNKYLCEVMKIAYSNFFLAKDKPNYYIIKNINLFQYWKYFKKENMFLNDKKSFDNAKIHKVINTNDNLVNSLISNIKTEISLQFSNELILSISQDKTSKSISHFDSTFFSRILSIQYNPKKTFYKKCELTLKSHNSIYDIIELSDGNLASCSSDNTIKIWSLSSEQCLYTLLGHKSTVWSLCQLFDGRLVSCSDDMTIKIWSLKTMLPEVNLVGHQDPIHTVIQLHNGKLASGSSDRTIKIWDIETKNCIATITRHTERVYRLLEIKPNIIVSSSYDKNIKVWDITNLSEGEDNINYCVRTLTGHRSYVWSIAKIRGYKGDFSNNNIIASGSTDTKIKIWNIEQEECLFTLEGHAFTVIALIQGNNGNLISGSYDKNIKIWDLNERVCVSTLIDHNNAVWALRQLRNGKLVSASWDTTIKVWD